MGSHDGAACGCCSSQMRHLVLDDDLLLAGGRDDAQHRGLHALVANQLDGHRNASIAGRDRVAKAQAVERLVGIQSAVGRRMCVRALLDVLAMSSSLLAGPHRH